MWGCVAHFPKLLPYARLTLKSASWGREAHKERVGSESSKKAGIIFLSMKILSKTTNQDVIWLTVAFFGTSGLT